MIVAMMLPTSLPLVALFHSFVREGPKRARRASAWRAPRAVLPRLLLVADAVDVRRRRRQHHLDVGTRCSDGGREERRVGSAAERAARRTADRLGARARDERYIDSGRE